ncbi:putative glycoside hydrolase [Candidatus Nomurabacteria bacterium]|nr:putative glycoside hydrolase [Candidatus Nomurabacteria bacterium]
MKKYLQKNKLLTILFLGLLFFLIFYFVLPQIYNLKYDSKINKLLDKENVDSEKIKGSEEIEPIQNIVTHIDTPTTVKAIYISGWVAGNLPLRTKILNIIKTTELNSIVIDVKDSTGRISFSVNDPKLIEVGSAEKRIRDIREFVALLHENNIYVIGRIATFQDPYLAKKWPEYAVKKSSNKNILWADDKCKRAIRRNSEKTCTYWMDAGSQKVWDYVASVGDEAYSDGFDELNFDYIRYPADGDLKDIYFPVSEGKIRADVMSNFYTFLHNHYFGLQNEKTLRPKISADIFGLTTTETNDLGIGQLLIPLATNFDYIAPMVYPSHFAPGTYGYKNPATKPYEIVNFSMKKANERLVNAGLDPLKLRPWLQDFDLGAIYTKEMVQAQIKAVYDAGLTSWMLWDPANTYTESALLSE